MTIAKDEASILPTFLMLPQVQAADITQCYCHKFLIEIAQEFGKIVVRFTGIKIDMGKTQQSIPQ